MFKCVCIYIYVYIDIYKYIYIYVNVCMCLCMCVFVCVGVTAGSIDYGVSFVVSSVSGPFFSYTYPKHLICFVYFILDLYMSRLL